MKLKDKEDIYRVFAFIKSVIDLVEDKNEMLGIFSKNPEKAALLPGLEVSTSHQGIKTLIILL